MRKLDPALHPFHLAGHEMEPSLVAQERRRRRWLIWVGLSIAALALSAVVHIHTPLGRAGAAGLLEQAIRSRISGDVEIGEITQLDLLGNVTMVDVRLTTPDGAEVLIADRMHLRFAPLESLSRGALVLADGWVEGGTMRITRGPEDRLALLEALAAPHDVRGVPVELSNVRVTEMTLVLSLPPVPLSLQIANASGIADVELGHQAAIYLRDVRGVANLPVAGVRLYDLRARLQSSHSRPLFMWARLGLDAARPTMRIHYDRPHSWARPGTAGLSVALGEGVPDQLDFGTVHH